MNKLFFAFCFLLLPVVSVASISYEKLNKLVATPTYLSGKFTQDKYLSELDTTLHSSGVFSYQRGESIRWETIEPIKNVLIMTPQRIINSQGDKVIISLDVTSNPVIAALSDIFFSVITAEWDALSAYFLMSGTLAESAWNVNLVPIDETMLQVVERVTLKGDSLLRELIFYEKNGDQTVIFFDALTE